MKAIVWGTLASLALAGSAGSQTLPDGADLFADRCGFCHLDAGGGQGPSLAGVVGRKAGAATGFDYSTALKTSGVVWTPDTLDRFLADPAAMIPGTAMPIHVPDAATRQAIISYLAARK